MRQTRTIESLTHHAYCLTLLSRLVIFLRLRRVTEGDRKRKRSIPMKLMLNLTSAVGTPKSIPGAADSVVTLHAV